jgi:hypothetical protein
MKVLLDENLSDPRLAARLRASGHDPILAPDVGLLSATDARLLHEHRGAAADRLDFGPNLGLGGPAISGPFWHLVGRRPLGDSCTLSDGCGEQHFLTVGGFSDHGTNGTR